MRHINELRSNPDKNPKISPEQELKDFLAKNNSNIQNYFITYRSDNKTGINPNNKHRTPIGIYAYPLQYVKEKLTKDIMNVEWGGHRKFAIILEYVGSNDKILRDIKSYTSQQWETDSDKIIELAKKDSESDHYGIYLPNNLQAIKNKAKETAFKNLPFFWIWNLMRLLTNQYSFNDHRKSQIYRTVQWNKYIRYIGYDAIVDGGLGLLHPNEPISSLFLTGPIVKNVKTIILNHKKDPQRGYYD